MTVLPKRWQVAPAALPGSRELFADLHPLTVQVLHNRGLTDRLQVEAFLGGQADGGDSSNLPDLAQAVARLRQALDRNEPVVVYGDFDADGVTATAILVQTLRALGGQVQHYIPHRVDEGYGLNERALDHLACKGYRLVVTADCGVRSVREVAHANRSGLDVVITDHHSVGPELPAAVAVIDPKREDNGYRFRELAGAGVAYRLAQALLRSHRRSPITSLDVRLEEEELLDLVALGTVADLVPLVDENRVLVRKGLARLNQMERPGVMALCEMARLKREQVDATAIGYALGPRLNAAGRLGHADQAYELLMTPYPGEATRLAEKLDHLNRTRQEMTLETQRRARDAARAQIEQASLIFVSDPKFHPGIVGLVAGRLAEEYYRPAVIVEQGEMESRGSARSIPEFDITAALDQCADLLVRHGGHAQAAGFTIESGRLGELEQRLHGLASAQLGGKQLAPVLKIDAETDLAAVSPKRSPHLHEELARLEPYGYANPQPLFVSRNVLVQGHKSVGQEGRHLKLRLWHDGVTWDGIAFGQGEWVGKVPDRVDIAYHVEADEWNGQKRLQLNIQDLRPSSP